MNDKLVYLSGPMANCTEYQATWWRKLATGYLDCPVLDPTRHDNSKLDELLAQGEIDAGAELICERDRVDLQEASHILVYPWKVSYGTPMEVMWAYLSCADAPIHVALDHGMTISPWLRYHSDAIHDTIQAACEAINASNMRNHGGPPGL